MDLLTLPINLLYQSPFTVCQIATPTVALISACKNILRGEDAIAARERIRVAIAAIEKFAEVWPRAAKTAKELKIIAREIFEIRKTTSPVQSFTSAPIQQYPTVTDSGYQGFGFLDDFMSGAQCDFSALGFDPSTDMASSSGSITGDTSANVTLAY